MKKISSSSGLSSAIEEILASLIPLSSPPILVFDFDRTLTNGISSPGEATLAKLVRGGSSTIAALSKAHALGWPLYIITARRPSALTIEQIYASLNNAQSALSRFFPRGPVTTFNHGEVRFSLHSSSWFVQY